MSLGTLSLTFWIYYTTDWEVCQDLFFDFQRTFSGGPPPSAVRPSLSEYIIPKISAKVNRQNAQTKFDFLCKSPAARANPWLQRFNWMKWRPVKYFYSLSLYYGKAVPGQTPTKHMFDLILGKISGEVYSS